MIEIIHLQTATELARNIREKQISPVEVIDIFLERVSSLNPKLNAIVTLAADEARAQAKKAEQAVMQGDTLGPLHGVPVAMKDLTATKGIRTTFGSLAFKDHTPDRDATVVTRLKEAGAIIIGKTNTPEFGYKGTTDNPLFGATKNPWDLHLTPGGSSGGSAAAVAARLIPVAEGSDGGGSIRIPASLCGVFGLKPSFGRIPQDSHLNNVFGSYEPFQHHGPLTHSVEDAALMLQVMQGPATTDPFSLPLTGENYRDEIKKGVQGLKVAYTPDFGIYEVAADVKAVIEQSIDHVRLLGCDVNEVSIDMGMDLQEFMSFFKQMWFVGISASYGELLAEQPDHVSEELAFMIREGEKLSAVEYKQVGRARTAIWHKVQELFNTYDLILSPTLGTTAFPSGLMGPAEINGRPIQPDSDWMLTQIFNVTGHPAASLPVGLTGKGLPVGLQIAGDRFQDAQVLRLSYAYETTYGKVQVPQL